MKSKTRFKVILSSVLAIICCLSLITGATLALFTAESQVEIAVTSGKVEVSASLEGLKLYSAKPDSEGTMVDQFGAKYSSEEKSGSFTNGGTATIENGTLTLDKVTPGDKAVVTVVVKNLSNVAIKYRTILSVSEDDGLFQGLKVTVNGESFEGFTAVSSYQTLLPEVSDIDSFDVEVELPMDRGNEYQNKSCSIRYSVEAVQSNASVADLPTADLYLYSVSDLKLFAKKVNEGEKEYKGQVIMLMSDLDLNNEPFESINSNIADKAFTFDGNNKVIKNLNVNNPVAAGLFDHAAGCTIKNLTVDGATVTGTNHVGVIVGNGLCTKIENCKVLNATVISNPVMKGDKYDDGDKAGAIAGYLSGEPTSYAKGCSVENVTVKAFRDLGAIAGIANGKAEVSGNTVSNAKLSYIFVYPYDGHDNENINDYVGRVSDNATVTSNTGDVTIGEKYVFTTKEELISFASSVNGGKSYAGETVKLGADIDLAGVNWTPIGGSTMNSYPGITFEGTFDGQGYTISNLTSSSNLINACAGLFGAITGMVKDVKLANVNVTSTHYAGAVVAYASKCGAIYNCSVDGGTVTSVPEWTGSAYDNGDKVGGIAGYGVEVIDGCSVSNLTIKGYRDIGGIIGCCDDASITNNTLGENVFMSYDLVAPYDGNTPNQNMGTFVGRELNSTVVTGNSGKAVRISTAATAEELNKILANIKNDKVTAHTSYVITLTATSYDNFKATLTTDQYKEVLITAPNRATVNFASNGLGGGDVYYNNAIFTVNGHSSWDLDAPVIVENIDFVLTGEACAFTTAQGDATQTPNPHYASNLQIKNCTVTSGDGLGCLVNTPNNSDPHDMLIEGCTMNSGHSIFSGYCTNLTVKNCVIKSVRGVNNQKADANNTNTVIEGCEFDCKKYCVRVNSGPLSISDSTLKTSSTDATDTAIVLRYTATADTKLTLSGVTLQTNDGIAQIYATVTFSKAFIEGAPNGTTFGGSIE